MCAMCAMCAAVCAVCARCVRGVCGHTVGRTEESKRREGGRGGVFVLVQGDGMWFNSGVGLTARMIAGTVPVGFGTQRVYAPVDA